MSFFSFQIPLGCLLIIMFAELRIIPFFIGFLMSGDIELNRVNANYIITVSCSS